MEIREAVSNKNGKYNNKSHRHIRPKFNNLVHHKKQIDCTDEDAERNKSLSHNKTEQSHIYKFKTVIQYKISINQEIIGRLNQTFIDLYNSINQSKYILDFEDNWDDNGSKAYQVTTWIKAVKFLIKFYNWRYKNSFPLAKPPKIYQGPDGTIDIYWKSSVFTYLINIPEEDSIASYYYKNSTGTIIEGQFDLDQFLVEELQLHFDQSFI